MTHHPVFLVLSRLVCLALVATLAQAGPALAQGYEGYALEAANRAGLLERCTARGFATQKDVADALTVLHARAQLPSAEHLKAATDEGRNGIVLAADEHIPFEKMAHDQQLSVQDMCGTIAASANMAAKMIERP